MASGMGTQFQDVSKLKGSSQAGGGVSAASSTGSSIYASQLEGKELPNVSLQLLNFSKGWEEMKVETVGTKDCFSGKRVLLIGITGAFTPVCSTKHLPDYIEHADEIKKLVSGIYIITNNDPFVLKQFAKELKADDPNKVIFLSDPKLDFARQTGLLEDLEAKHLGQRNRRVCLLIENNTVRKVFAEDDSSNPKQTYFPDVFPHIASAFHMGSK